MSQIDNEGNRQWKPKSGEEYWYVSVPDCWDFENTKVIHKKDGPTGEVILHNCFKTEAEAKAMANVIRRLWGYPPLA